MAIASTFHRCLAAAAAAGVVMVTPHSASASVGGGNVSIGWSIGGAPTSGLTNVTFPITVNADTAHQAGIYFAQQYTFGSGQVGYTGLQPRGDSGGREQLHAVFSVFGDGAGTTDPNCHTGADGGPGVSCGIDFDAVYGHRYDIRVETTGNDTWTGTATDSVTKATTHIGSYTLEAGSGNIRDGQVGFVEYYAGVPSCATEPRADVVFGGPTSTDAGGLKGKAWANYEYSDCVGQANYRARSDGTGTHVTRGLAPLATARKPAATSAETAPPPARAAQPQTVPGRMPSPSATLARTGSGPGLPLAGAGSAVLLMGSGMLWAATRRRRRRHARA